MWENITSAGLLLLLGLIQQPMAHAGNPKCFMHGMITPTGGNTAKPSVSDMIRLHFDADKQSKCELMLKSYCQYNVLEKEYSPLRLKASWKPDVAKDEEVSYEFDKKCKLISGED